MCISLLFGEHFNILNDRKSGELNVFREWKTGGNVLYNDINLLPFDCFPEKNGEEDVLHRVQQNRTNEIPVS